MPDCSDSPRQYVPGACNLGRTESRIRFLFGWGGVLLAVGLAWGLIVGGAAPAFRWLVFIPAFFGTLGLIEAFAGFCVTYGVFGVFNMGARVGHWETVEQTEARRKDRQTAARMILLSAVVAAGVTAVVSAFPL